MKNTLHPLVSIVIITYNSSAYVLETLESAKAQTYENIELIVSDDCSHDNTVQICKNWIQKNNDRFIRTELITTPVNTGTPENCNRAVKASSGKWIKTIAGDDILLDNCILDFLSFTEENPEAEFIISSLDEIDTQSLAINTKNSIGKDLKFYFSGLTANKQLKNYARWPVFLNSPTFFFKKETMATIGYYDAEFKIYDDMCLIYKINSYNIKIYYLNKSTVKYRIHENAVSRTSNKQIYTKREKEALAIFKKYRKKHLNIFNPIDLSIYYECWLMYRYKGFRGHKGLNVLNKFSIFYWYRNYFV